MKCTVARSVETFKPGPFTTSFLSALVESFIHEPLKFVPKTNIHSVSHSVLIFTLHGSHALLREWGGENITYAGGSGT